MRKFYLQNEKGQRYNFQDTSSLIFSQIAGLGISYNYDYTKVGNRFIANKKEKNLGQLTGNLNFIGRNAYKDYQDFANFILSADKLQVIYIPIEKEYLIDVDLNIIDKTERDKFGNLICPVTLNIKSPFYIASRSSYTATNENVFNKWDFKWDVKFVDYSTAEMIVENKGLTPASFEFILSGYVNNPSVEIYRGNVLIAQITFDITVYEGEYLYYSNVDTNQLVQKIETDGEIINIFNSLNMNNNNFPKLPIGASKFLFKEDVPSIELTIFDEWEQV